VNEECLKLTTYFGERDRTQDGLLADELLDVYGGHRLAASILLRGSEGFGAGQHVRTDRLLSLSEDLPVVSIAVDRLDRIEAMLEPVLQIKRRGLITLERARMLSGEIGTVELPQTPGHESKLTVYVGRHERSGERPAYVAITDLLHARGIAGASVLLGVDGTRGGRRFRASFFGRNAEVPCMVIAVGNGTRIAQALPEVAALVREPLMTLERVRVCKRDGALLATPHELPGTDEQGRPLWQKLTIYASQSATWQGHPLNLQIIHRLRESGAAGATSMRGIWGFHGDHAPHGDRFLQLRRRVPVVTTVIDSPQRIEESFLIIDEITAGEGLVTSEMVPALRALGPTEPYSGTELASYDC
jgi:PII-like signaling protein